MKKIGILGGTFDPPHFGHLLIANEVYHGLELDEVWFLPNQEPPHKKKNNEVSNENRVAMLKLATEGISFFKVETIELERLGPSYSYDTMKQLIDRYPTVQFHFIIGGDMIEYLPKWYKIEELLKMVSFVGVNRPHYQAETPFPIQHLEVPNVDVSSSLIRNRVAEGKTIRYLLPDTVIDYLKENRLYESR